jgi:hypothetical protein
MYVYTKLKFSNYISRFFIICENYQENLNRETDEV